MEPYLGEIRLVAFNQSPRGWLACEGQTLKVTEYQALYSLLGARYGGDGRTTFQLPDLRGRTPLHRSGAYPVGVAGGTETVTLKVAQMPAHTHAFKVANTEATVGGVAGAWYAAPSKISPSSGPTAFYGVRGQSEVVSLYPGCLKDAGGSQPHSNMQPYLALKYIIAINGIYPPRP